MHKSFCRATHHSIERHQRIPDPRQRGANRRGLGHVTRGQVELIDRLLTEICKIPDANYRHKNKYWNAWCIKDLIASCGERDRQAFEKRLQALRTTYDKMSAIYQKNKGSGAEILLT